MKLSEEYGKQKFRAIVILRGYLFSSMLVQEVALGPTQNLLESLIEGMQYFVLSGYVSIFKEVCKEQLVFAEALSKAKPHHNMAVT